MPGDKFYKLAVWRKIRQKVLHRDGHRCVIRDCENVATIVDHIWARPKGEAGLTSWDRMENLRSLCSSCDAKLKERGGRRHNDGKLVLKQHSEAGLPLDAEHSWNCEAKHERSYAEEMEELNAQYRD